MTSRGVSRDRFRRDHTGRPEEKSRGKAPPSRHLWIGNLSHNISERTLAEHFLNFGELESVAFQPGRSYAFINFKRREEAIAALRELQGFPVAGMPLRVEFAKADKPSTPPRDEVFSQRHDEEHSPRDSRPRHASPGPFYPSKSRTSEKNEESPSEVLWVGFPALLKVDEMILKKAFSPFGEIEKITAFPGRSYAFVRFRSVIAAWRAKETLQGKLFGNPRVHICFAKSETGVSNTGKNSINALPSTHMKSNSRPVFSENIREDRNFGSFVGDSSVRSPDFLPQFDAGESEFTKFSRKRSSWRDEHDTYDRKAFPELSSEIRASADVYGRRSSPINDRSQFRDFSPRKFPRKSPALKELWDLPEDSTLFYGAKKLKTGPFRPEKELPEYPFSDHEQEKQPLPRVFSDFPPHAAPDRTFDHGSFGYKQSSDQPKSITLSHRERGDKWIESHDSPQVHSGYFNRAPPKRLTPEPKQPSLSEWKWEGTIAKGGTPVCRARCFPVGKIRDISLPECLDCTARTGLDMLAKHYYQAANAWVVFFVPETDADIGLYNEFMNYLGEKQRAAVAKLDDKNTLFLVPPSDFSEKVLKVPGKLSISGVILRLEHPGSDAAVERRDFMSFPRREASSPSGPASPVLARFSGLGKSAVENEPFPEHVSRFPHASFSGSSHTPESYNNQTRHDFVPKQWNPELGHSQINTHRSQSSVSGSRNMAPQSAPQSFNPNSAQEMRSDPFASLQPEQLAQLASSLLGQQRQLQSTNNQPEDSFRVSERFVPQHNPTPPELLTSQFGQEVQQQQNTNQREVVAGVQGDHVMQNTTSAQEEAEPDPQKRLQATLQLAAALLQQIQQGKGT